MSYDTRLQTEQMALFQNDNLSEDWRDADPEPADSSPAPYGLILLDVYPDIAHYPGLAVILPRTSRFPVDFRFSIILQEKNE